MSEPPASPGASRLATPSWLDGRLVLGVLLVLVSVVVGARVLSAADRSTLVWAASKDLSAGSQLSDGDLEQVRVRLFDGLEARYVPAGQSPAGLLLERGLEGGELLPRASLLSPQEEVDRRLVTVPVEAAHFPLGLVADQQVDVWLTPTSAPARAPAAAPADSAEPVDPAGPPVDGAAGPDDLPLVDAQPVLLRVLVESVQDRGAGLAGSSATVPVVLSVRPDDVERLVSAMSVGRIDLVRVPKSVERTSVELDAAAG